MFRSYSIVDTSVSSSWLPGYANPDFETYSVSEYTRLTLLIDLSTPGPPQQPMITPWGCSKSPQTYFNSGAIFLIELVTVETLQGAIQGGECTWKNAQLGLSENTVRTAVRCVGLVVDRAIESMVPINNRPATANSGHTSRFEAVECIQSLVSRRS